MGGHAPASPDQLRAFSIESATPIPWKAANDYIQSITPTPALQKRFVFYQFRDCFYSINVTHKQTFTVDDLRSEVISCTRMPTEALTFTLEDELISDFKMDIIKFFEVYDETSILSNVQS